MDVHQMIASGRRGVADLLESLDEHQLATPSLCAGWDARTVAGHLADAAAPGLREGLVDLVRARGRLHRANDISARRMAARPVPEIAALLRQRADSRFTPPVTGIRAPLTDLLVHEGDIRTPLGLPHDPDPAAVRAGLEFVSTGRTVGFVPRGRLSGLHLVATDLDWAWGDGPAVEGRGIHLLMAACGRATAADRLHGPGAELLRQRVGGPAR